MTMLDNRNSPQPGSSDFGNWQKAANIGLFGMNPVVSFAGLVLVLGAGGMMMFLGPLAAVAALTACCAAVAERLRRRPPR